MTRSELTESLSRFRACRSSSVRHPRAGEVFEMPGGLGIANGNVSRALLDMAFLIEHPTGGVAAWTDRVQRIRDYFRAARRSWMLAVCTDWMTAEDGAAVETSGLGYGSSVTGMVAERLLPPARPLPTELEYRRVGDEATRLAVADINAQCGAVRRPRRRGRTRRYSRQRPSLPTGKQGGTGFVE